MELLRIVQALLDLLGSPTLGSGTGLGFGLRLCESESLIYLFKLADSSLHFRSLDYEVD